MLLRIILISLALASISACSKNKDIEPKPDLPPLTTEGKNTFACYINGVPWEHGVPGFNLSGPTLEPRFYNNGHPLGDSIISIRAWNHYYSDFDKIKYDILDLRFFPTTLGYVDIPSNTNPQCFTRRFNSYPGCIYYLDTTKMYKVNLVHFDLINRIASGTFEMTLYNSTTCNDTLVITDGRFDVRFLIE